MAEIRPGQVFYDPVGGQKPYLALDLRSKPESRSVDVLVLDLHHPIEDSGLPVYDVFAIKYSSAQKMQLADDAATQKRASQLAGYTGQFHAGLPVPTRFVSGLEGLESYLQVDRAA